MANSETFEFHKDKQQLAFESSDLQFEHTAENYEKVLFWSFMLSQGNPQSQKSILEYIVSQVGVFDKNIYSRSLFENRLTANCSSA